MHVYTVYKAKYQHYTTVTSYSMSTCVPMHLNRAINIDNYAATPTCTRMSAITKNYNLYSVLGETSHL